MSVQAEDRPPALETIALPDEYTTRVRWWRPEKPAGAVLYFHGIQSHGGWYETSGAKLAAGNLVVLMPDRRGSGSNDSPRGHFASVDQCRQDAEHLFDTLRERTGIESVHVVGVSWGGKQAVLLARHRPQQVKSVTLICPGLFPKIDLTLPEKFHVAMSMVNERSKLFDIPLNDARSFTANPDRIAFVREDRLKLQQVSASFLLVSRRLDREVRRFRECAYRGPIHLFLAGRDQIIDNEPTRRWLRDLPSPDRRITEYPTAEHTLEFEADPSEFFHDLTDWIAGR